MKNPTYSRALRLALVYASLSGLWILLSDRLVGVFAQDAQALTLLQNLKGWAFVAVTATLLYFERRRSDERIGLLANIVDSSDDAIVGLNLNGEISSWNPGASRMYGYVEGEAVGLQSSFLLPVNRREEIAQYLERVRLGEHPDPYETERVGKGDKKIDVSLTVSPIFDARGKIVGASTIARDISVQKQMRAGLEAQRTALERFTRQILNSQEEERKRISRELHDQTVQDLLALSQRVELAKKAMERDPAAVTDQLDQLHQLAVQATAGVRRMSNDLRPMMLEDLGLKAALSALCDELAEAMPSAQVSIGFEGSQPVLPSELELTIFRLIQEALTNIRKHSAEASEVRVAFYFEDWGVLISVEDDGMGFQTPDLDELSRAGHLGLSGMRERVHLFEGEMSIDSDPGRGTAIVFRLPVLQDLMQPN